MRTLTHFQKDGSVRMVDVTAKRPTTRRARAHGMVKMSSEVLLCLPQNPKGNPLEIAKIAGITAAKQTALLIPLCHTLPLTHVSVELRLVPEGVEIESSVVTHAVTGVEMEALTAVSVAALTVYDMCKAIDKSMTITDIFLLEKRGGKSGTYLRKAPGKLPAKISGRASGRASGLNSGGVASRR